LPIASVGVSWVLDTLGVRVRGLGSLACWKFSPAPGPWRRERSEVDNGREDVRARNSGSRLRMEGTREAMLSDVLGDSEIAGVVVEANGGDRAQAGSQSEELQVKGLAVTVRWMF
jgi:hypothetical protein